MIKVVKLMRIKR